MKKLFTILCMFVLFSTQAKSQVFFSENFDGTSGTTPPAGWLNFGEAPGDPTQIWTFMNVAVPPPTTPPSGAGFANEYAILNSDAYGSGQTQNAVLETPPISTLGRTNVHVNFSEQFRFISPSSGTFSISTNGGTTWDPIFVRSSTIGHPNPAVFTEVAIPQADNQADVRFRFRYEGTFGWWWAIDNFGLREGSSLVPLVGGTTYPINGVQNPPVSFENISSAVDYININGVTGTGTVLFEMNTGYTGMEPGPISLGNVDGTGPTLDIVFRPAAGFTAVTEVVGGATPNQHAFSLAGCSYVTLDGRQGGIGDTRDWTIRVTGTTNAQMAVRLMTTTGPMTDIHIRNIIMEGAASNVTGAIFQIAGTSANTLNNVIVENNIMRSIGTASPEVRGYGITVTLTNASNTGIEIRNNDIVNTYARGINITGANPGAKYYGNRIYHTADITMPTATEFSGIYYSSTSVNGEGTEIFGNMIYDIRLTNNSTTATTGAQGIYLFSAHASGDPLRVYNNVISIGGLLTGTANNANVYGIRENTSSATNPALDIFYNSVYVSGETTTGANGSAGFYKQLSSNVNLSNNVFFNARSNDGGTGTHWGIRSNNTSFASLSNNDYFANGVGGVLGTTDGSASGNQMNIVDWRAAVGSDPGSVSVNPNYLNPTASPPDLMVNVLLATPLESGAIEIAGITTDFAGTPRYPNVGYPENPLFPPTNPDMGAYEFAGEPSDISPPAMVYDPLSNTGSLGNRTLEVTITDPSGVQLGANGPRLYYKKSTDMAYQFDATPSVSGDDYTFTINVASMGGVASGDTIEYYVAAQDSIGNAGTNPGGGAGVSPPGTTPPPTPNTYLVTDPPLAGDYTIGVVLFREVTGKNITFEERVRTVEKEIYVSDAELNPSNYETTPSELRITANGNVEEVGGSEPITDIPMVLSTVTYEETYYVPMLNGQEYEGKLYHEFTAQDRISHGISPDGVGVFATITEAVEEVITVGVDGPTRFLLLDATYPSETFPITFESFPGASSTNTLTLLPAVGVTSLIEGTVNFPIIRLSEVSHVIIDGRQDGVSNPHSLTISQLNGSAGGHGIQFIDGSTENVIQFCNIVSVGAPNAGNGAIHFSTSVGNPDGNSMNLVSNNNILGGRSGILMSGTAGNQNDQNVIQDNEIFDFGFAGIWLSGNTNNTIISGNEIFTTTPTLTVANSGINIAATAGGDNHIFNNKLIDIQNNATTTIRGITMSAAAGSVWNIYNNFFANSVDNGTKTSIYMIQNSGANAYTANIYFNSFSLAGTHVGGTAGTIVSGGYVKSSTGDFTEINYKNNVVLNTRTGGDGIHLGTWFGTPAGVTDFNYNTHFSNGGATSFNAGYDGTVYNVLADYQAAIAPHEANSLFKLTNFVSTTDLHVTGASVGDLDLIGTPITGITTDIDGDVREASFPYQGADEGDIPLPVDLASFTAMVDKNDVTLNWTTSWEENNDKFVIQRRVAESDAQWQNAGTVAGSGTVYEERHYNFTDRNLTTGIYEYRLVQFDYDGNSTADHNLSNTVEIGTPNTYALSQNYPNPFNPTTKINFEIPVEGLVRLHVYDMSGRLVSTLINESVAPGYHIVEFNGANMASGVYFYRLVTDHSVITKRMVLVK